MLKRTEASSSYLTLLKFICLRFLVKTLFLFLLTTFITYTLLSYLPASDNEAITFSYADWLTNLIETQDFGYSDFHIGQTVISRILVGTRTTILVSTITLLLSSLIGTGFALFLYSPQNLLWQGPKFRMRRLLRIPLWSTIYVVSSFPVYLLGYFLFYAFHSDVNLLFALLCCVFGSGLALEMFRNVSFVYRSELAKPYIQNALALGLRTTNWIPGVGSVAWHAFRNVIPIILPLFSSKLPFILSSVFLIEIMFEMPGLSDSFLSGLLNRDAHMVLAIIALSVLFIQIVSFLSELIAFLLNPDKSSL